MKKWLRLGLVTLFSALTLGSLASCSAYYSSSNDVIANAPHVHTYGNPTTVAPTCTKDGYETRTCTGCGEEKKDNFVPASHTWAEVVTVQHTCTEQGYDLKTCGVCGETEKENFVEAAHAWGAVVTVAPTCKDQGYDKKACGKCGEEERSNYTVTTNDHKWGPVTTVAPSCTTQGYDSKTCSTCGTTAKENYVSAGHKWGVTTTIAPTCTTDGYTQTPCMRCDYVEKTNFVNAAHSWGTKTTVAATCTAQGYDTKTCGKCGEEERSNYKATNDNHAWGEVTTVFPTCTEQGYDTKTCGTCGREERSDYVNAGHKWGETITIAPTLLGQGYDMKTCGVCGEVEKSNYTQPPLDYEESVAIISNIMASPNATATSTGTASVVDFNGGKAYGTSATGISDGDLYFAMPYAPFAEYFAAYPTASAVTFDTYSKYAVKQGRWYHGITTEGTPGNNNIYAMVANEYEKVNVGGTEYYKTTWAVNRATFESYPANVSLVFRYYGGYGSVIDEFYVDNFGAIVEYPASYDFESGRVTPVAYIGRDMTISGYTFANVTVKDEAGNATTSRMMSGVKTSLMSGTIYFPVDRAYMDKVFADPNVTHFQFDLIANWPSANVANLVIEDNTYTQKSLATYADLEEVSVNDTAGFYKVTVRLDRATYVNDVNSGKAADYITFRFKWGGLPTEIYFDNFQGVTVTPVLSDTYYDRHTVNTNAADGATYTSSSSTYALCFNQSMLIDAFYTQGAQSISFTLAAEGYDIVGFRNWIGDLVYCRPVIWKSGVGTAASHQPLNNATWEIVDGKAVITIDATEFTKYFDETGAYKDGSHSNVTTGVGFGIRLSCS